MTTLRVTVRPDKGQYRPGDTARMMITVAGTPGTAVDLDLRLTQLARTVTRWTRSLLLDESGEATVPEQIEPSGETAWQAYGIDVTATGSSGERANASSAFDVAEHWKVAPRYGFLSDFEPAESNDPSRLDSMAELHVSCVQFYDWMYRHHAYLPPPSSTGPITDVLGRRIDFSRVRSRIDGCAQRGMAPIAYASVYGAEESFSDEHPDWLLYDLKHRPMSLAKTFYIQDPSPGCGWREHLFGEYRAALELGFVGLHCDTYGSPKGGLARRGDGWTHVGLDTVLPDLVADADELARERHAQGGAMLNCVSGWPLEQVAQTASAVLYIEVWPPHSTYRDLHELVLRARRLDPSRRVVLAAYIPYFHPDTPNEPVYALQGLRLTSAAIFASGGFHLLPGEGRAVLADSYYPHYGRLNDDAWQVLRAYWSFHTRYGPLLADPEATDVSSSHLAGPARELVVDDIAASPMAEPGTVWTVVKQTAARTVIHLINLTSIADPRWTVAQPPAPPLREVRVRVEAVRPIASVWTATPDNGGSPHELPFEISEAEQTTTLIIQVPRLATWTMLVVEWADSD